VVDKPVNAKTIEARSSRSLRSWARSERLGRVWSVHQQQRGASSSATCRLASSSVRSTGNREGEGGEAATKDGGQARRLAPGGERDRGEATAIIGWKEKDDREKREMTLFLGHLFVAQYGHPSDMEGHARTRTLFTPIRGGPILTHI
jgi:hypothetical protein